jgi:hypothetical protein
MHYAPALLAALTLVSSALAQPALRTIDDGTKYGVPNFDKQHSHLQTVDNDGNLWAVMQKAGPTLLVSTDDGLTWTRVARVTTKNNLVRLGMAAGTDCHLLHLGWEAKDGATVTSIYYQTFDTATRKWIGTPSIVAVGSTGGNGWKFMDIEVTPKGAVVLGIQTKATPPTLRAYTGHLIIKPAGRKAFSPPLPIRPYSGVALSMHAIGEVVHMGYRMNVNGWHVAHRAFDTSKLAFVGKEVVVAGKTLDQMDIVTGKCLAADDAGNLYIAYGIGDVAPATVGEIKVAFANPPYSVWTRRQVATDPNLIARQACSHFSLVQSAGAEMTVVYSKFTETYKNIYSRRMIDGAFTTPETAMITSTTSKFSKIAGHRSHAARTGLMAMTREDSKGIVYLLDGTTSPTTGRSGHLRYFGYACSGSLAMAPRIQATTVPTASQPLTIVISQAPKSVAGLLALGVTCQAPAFNLKVIGAPGCGLFQDLPLILGYSTDANGVRRLTFPVPASVKGFGVRLQSGVVAAGANAAGLLFTRSLGIFP